MSNVMEVTNDITERTMGVLKNVMEVTNHITEQTVGAQ